jgi:hypothetical protein
MLQLAHSAAGLCCSFLGSARNSSFFVGLLVRPMLQFHNAVAVT